MQCYYHSGRPAAVTCNRCGKGLCTECGSYFSPPVCVDCASREASKTRTTMITSIAISVVLMIAGVAIIQNPMGILLAGIPSGWRFLNKITPAMFLWMPLVGWLIYFGIKFLLSYFIGLIVMPIELIRDIRSLIAAKQLQEYANKIHNR